MALTLHSLIASGLEHQYDGPNKHLFAPSNGVVLFGTNLGSSDSMDSLDSFDSLDALDFSDS